MRYILLIGLIAISICSNGQTKDKKNNISIGGGKESYNGQLGNSWFNFSEEWYGFVNLSYSRYLNKSFDALAFGTVGDIGRCRDDDASHNVLNLYVRMSSAVFALKYKFANGYLLKEDARISPFIFLGAGINNLTDIWNHIDCNAGNDMTINGGVGATYNFTKRFNFGYRMGFGYFTKPGAMDYSASMRAMYMQNTFCLGFNF